MNPPQSAAADSALTGSFLDGPIRGLRYRTPSREGITDEQGRFFYKPGETVTFSVGDLVIGNAIGSDHLTVANLYNRDDIRDPGKPNFLHPATVNRARFMQSLARETDLRNGVVIDDTVEDVVRPHAPHITFDADTETFEQAILASKVFDELGLRLRGAAEARNHLRRAHAGIRVLRDERVPTRDGSHLVADVFYPIEPGPHPVIMRMSIYGRAFELGSIFDEADLAASEEREDAWFEAERDSIPELLRYSENAISANASTWVPRGYVIVRVDARGVGSTPGKLDPFSRQEALDYYDAIQWAAVQPWSDGNVGLLGGSYNATIQWNVAALRPPALKAIAPLASDADAYRDLAYPGGILLGNYRRWWWRELVDKARGSGEAVDLVQGMASHPWDDEYYHRAQLISADFASIDIPVLTAVSQTMMIHGRAGFEAFTQLASPEKRLLVMDAPYIPFMYDDCLPDQEAFFDQFLKGQNPEQQPAAVRMVMRTGYGNYEWREETGWPVPGTEYRTLFLEAARSRGPRTISPQPPARIEYASYSADVHALEEELPMAVFVSAPLEQDIELAGHFRASLWISSTSIDADVFVALRVMDGNDEVYYQTRDPSSVAPLTWGCLKASHRALDPERSTTERPWHTHQLEDSMPLVPEEVVKIEVELMAATGRISAGHHLRLEISAGEGRGANPEWERDYDEAYHRGAVNRVFTGGPFASCITIPVVPTTRRSGFESP
jgi:predicted acyl esterase